MLSNIFTIVEEMFEIWLTQCDENDIKMALMMSNIFTMVEEIFEIWPTQCAENDPKMSNNAE